MAEPTLTQPKVPVEDNSDEDPQLSSAAQCIEFQLNGVAFRPVFTHQIFPREYIPGYRPVATLGSHTSHDYHNDAKHTLKIVIKLAPSCQSCQVDLQVKNSARFETNADHEPTVPKRARFSDDKQASVLSESEVFKTLSNLLPPIQSEPPSTYLTEPIGKLLETYSVNDKSFCLCMSKGSKVAAYHNNIQKLAFYFIENASDVDLSDESEGYWTVLYLFQQFDDDKYGLAGYTTLFHFKSPFRKPPGTIVRIAQCLLLPPYQRCGHGQRMLLTLYSTSYYDDDMTKDPTGLSKIVEINVEDPASGFTALRNIVDYKRFCACPWLSLEADPTKDSFFASLEANQVTDAATKARVTKLQVHVVHELDRLQLLDAHLHHLEENNRRELETKYRLMVKKRLNKHYREELGCRSKDEQKEMLGNYFDQQLADYRSILCSIAKG